MVRDGGEVVDTNRRRTLVDGWQVRLAESTHIEPSRARASQPKPLTRVPQREVEIVAINQKGDSNPASPGHKKNPPES